MKKRIGEKSKGCYIGTIHGLAYQILRQNRIDASAVINEENFDEMFNLILARNCKLPDVEYLLIDEFQDTGEKEYDFLMGTLHPKNYFIVGDTRQQIYSFKNGSRNFFNEQLENPFTQIYELNDDYRNYQEIGEFANRLISKVKNLYKTPTTYVRGYGGQVIEEEFSFSTLLKYLGTYRDYKNWFILARTNKQVDEICSFLDLVKVPNITFKKADKSAEEIQQLMNSDRVKVLTIHSAKGLERKNVMVVGARYYDDEERRIGYVAATRAEDLLVWLNGDMPKKKKTPRQTRQTRAQKQAKIDKAMALEDWG